MSRGAKKLITCKCGCGRQKEVRVADINRGWGMFFSKTCKAKAQEKRTGQNANFLQKQRYVRYQQEYGGYPQFSQSGEFEGVALSLECMAESNVNP